VTNALSFWSAFLIGKNFIRSSIVQNLDGQSFLLLEKDSSAT
jgi:hypothetical protein